MIPIPSDVDVNRDGFLYIRCTPNSYTEVVCTPWRPDSLGEYLKPSRVTPNAKQRRDLRRLRRKDDFVILDDPFGPDWRPPRRVAVIQLTYSSETKPGIIPPLPPLFAWVPRYPNQSPWYRLENGTWRADAVERQYANASNPPHLSIAEVNRADSDGLRERLGAGE